MGKPIQRRHEIDEMLTGEYTLEEISQHAKPIISRKGRDHLTRERVRQYIRDTGQYDTYIAKRVNFKKQKVKEKHQRTENRRNLLNVLRKYVLEKSGEDWAVQKALSYKYSCPVRRLDSILLENLVVLFSAYKEALNSNVKLSLEELSQRSGIKFVTIGQILKKVGLEPMHGAIDRHPTPPHKKEAIIETYDLDVPIDDIAYFLEMKPFNVRAIMSYKFGDTGERLKYIASFGMGNRKETVHLNYRTASQVYQAQDWGWSEDDITYCFDGHEKMVKYTIGHRPHIETEIIKLLDVLYPDVKHDKPYL